MPIQIKTHPGHNLTIRQCLENAENCHHRRVESFQRCDTDGFLSQYADELAAMLWQKKAQIVERGGFSDFPVLVNAAGQVVADRSFANDYGNSWLVYDEFQEQIGRKWIPMDDSHHNPAEIQFKPKRSRVQKRAGLKQCQKPAQAWACIEGRSAIVFPLRGDDNRLQFGRGND